MRSLEAMFRSVISEANILNVGVSMLCYSNLSNNTNIDDNDNINIKSYSCDILQIYHLHILFCKSSVIKNVVMLEIILKKIYFQVILQNESKFHQLLGVTMCCTCFFLEICDIFFRR
jgi:hypothetical protein